MRRNRGQVTLETAVLFGVVVAGIVAMAAYLQRGVQGGLRSNADSFGTQFSATDPWTSYGRSDSKEEVATIKSNQSTHACQGVGQEKIPGCVQPVVVVPRN